MGPGYANFAEVVNTLKRADALVLANQAELRETLDDLLTHPAEAAALGERARAVCAQNSGATARAAAALLALVRP